MTDPGFRPNLDGYVDAGLDLARHVEARTLRALADGARALDGIEDPAGLRAHQESVRAAVLAGIGGLPAHDLAPPEVEHRGGIDRAGHRVERLILTTMPGVRAPATLYLPRAVGPGAALPAVLFVCGHTPVGKADPEYQAVCATLADAGNVVLAVDPWGQGERQGYLDADGAELVPGGTAEHTYAGIQSWWRGRSSARWFVHEARRGIDLLASLESVDPQRIAVTGNSGGGMLCTLLLALEPRITAAAVGTYVTSRAAYLRTGKHQDAEQILLGGTARGVDHADLLASFAPKPLAILAADYDFFPIEGTLETVARAGRAYRRLGAEDRLRLVRAPVTHRYAPQLAAAAADFLRAAMGPAGPRPAPDPGTAADASVLDPADLQCTRTGQIATDDPSARFLHDLERDGLDDQATPDPADAVRWVRDRVLADRRPPSEEHPRWLPGQHGALHGLWRSEEDLWGAGILIPGAPAADAPARGGSAMHDGEAAPALRILLQDGGSPRWARERSGIGPGPGSAEAGPLLVLDVRGMGALVPRDKDGLPPESMSGALYKQLCDLLWLGDSLVAGRAFDLIRAIDVVLGDPVLARAMPGIGPGLAVEVAADGAAGLSAVLAAVLDPRIRRVRASRLPDPARILRERLHDDGRGRWQAVLPGMPHRAPLSTLADLLGERLERIGDSDPVDRAGAGEERRDRASADQAGSGT